MRDHAADVTRDKTYLARKDVRCEGNEEVGYKDASPTKNF